MVWESSHPSKGSSRWQAPGIFFNVELGVSFSPDRRTHATGLKFTSRRMEHRLHQERVRRQKEAGYHYQEPGEVQQLATLGALMPGPDATEDFGNGYQAGSHTRHQQQLETQRRQSGTAREQRQRGVNTTPRMSEQNQDRSLGIYNTHVDPVQYTHSTSLEHTGNRQLSAARVNQALPPAPSQFRLGDEEMPWSSPLESSVFAASSAVGLETENRRMEDPVRVRELSTLQQAMMTVDSLGNEWNPGTWEDAVDSTEGPRNVGWAVSSHHGHPSSPPMPAPPPYVVSQWEQRISDSPKYVYS